LVAAAVGFGVFEGTVLPRTAALVDLEAAVVALTGPAGEIATAGFGIVQFMQATG